MGQETHAPVSWRRYNRPYRRRACRPPTRTCFRSIAMTWETPTAVDYRFGFEITMYMYHD